MADILELIKSRRTIKKFLPKYVSWENVSKVLDAARHAPSSGNIQNWKFIVIIDPDAKQSLAEAAHEQYEIITAPTLVVVCAEPEKAERYYGEKGKSYTLQSCAAAVENMLLEAHSLGLASAWIGAFNEDEVSETLGLPEEILPFAIIALGYAKETVTKPVKYPLETLVYFNGWRGKLRDPAKYMIDISTILARKAGYAKDALKSLVKKEE